MNKQFVVLGFLLTSILLAGCGISRPSVENLDFASVGYKHSGKETTCSACHWAERPVTSVGFAGPNASIPFNYTKHASGTIYADCVNCHSNMPLTGRTKANWSNGAFHQTLNPQPSACIGCHDSERPTADVLYIPSAATIATTATFSHLVSGMSECIACHQNPRNYQDPYTNVAGSSGWWEGSPQPAGLVSNASFTITVKTPTVTNYVQLTTSASYQYPLSIDHQLIDAVQLSVGGTPVSSANCMACHNSSLVGGLFHSKIPSGVTITSCSGCHSNAEPAGFVSSRPNWYMNHAAVGWTGDIHFGFTQGSTQIITNHDCVNCHTYTANNTLASPPFSNAAAATSFHTKVSGLTSCMDCHMGNRPSIPPGTATNWLNTSWSTRQNASSSLFTNGVLSTGTLTASMRANLTTLDLSSHAKAVDCAVCHATANASAAAWTSSVGTFNHMDGAVAFTKDTNCLACHAYPSTGTFSISSAVFSHLNQTGNCASCHANAINNLGTSPTMTDWYPGTAFPTTTTTISSVTGGTFSGVGNNVAPTLGSISYNILGMVHTGTLGIIGTAVSSGSYVIAGGTIEVRDCVICHRNYPTVAASVNTGTFHINVNLVSPNALAATADANCVLCHDPASGVPSNAKRISSAGVVGSKRGSGLGIDHSKITAGTTCLNCHTAPSATSPGVKWATSTVSVGSITTLHDNTGKVTAATYASTSCKDCHYNKMSVGFAARALQTATLIGAGTYGGSTSSQLFSHSVLTAAQQGCGDCHTAPTVAGVKFNSTNAVVFHTKVRVSGSACNTCHQDPSGSVGGSPNPAGGFYGYRTHSGNSECSTCHLQAVIAATSAVTTGSLPSVGNWAGGNGHANSGATSTTGNCLECHNNGSTSVTNPAFVLPSWNKAATSTGTSSHMAYSVGTGTSAVSVNSTALITMGSNSATVTYASISPAVTICAGLTITAGSSVFLVSGASNTTASATALVNKAANTLTSVPVTITGVCTSTASSATNSCTSCHLDYSNFINAATGASLAPLTSVTGGVFPAPTGGTYVKYSHSNANTNFSNCYVCHQFNKSSTNVEIGALTYAPAQIATAATTPLSVGTYYFAFSNPKYYMQTTGTFTGNYTVSAKSAKVLHVVGGNMLNQNIAVCSDCHSYSKGWDVTSHPTQSGRRTCQQCHDSAGGCSSGANTTYKCGAAGMPPCMTTNNCN